MLRERKKQAISNEVKRESKRGGKKKIIYCQFRLTLFQSWKTNKWNKNFQIAIQMTKSCT